MICCLHRWPQHITQSVALSWLGGGSMLQSVHGGTPCQHPSYTADTALSMSLS